MAPSRGRPRIVSDRIIEVLKEATGPMSPKEIKDALEAKGYKHAYEPILRNLEYLRSKMIAFRWIYDSWFLPSTENKRGYVQGIFQLMVRESYRLTEEEQNELWLRITVAFDNPLVWMETQLRKRNETMNVTLDSDSEEMRLAKQVRASEGLLRSIQEAKQTLEEYEKKKRNGELEMKEG